MTLEVRVDTASPVPPYEQIRAQLSDLIDQGRLGAGDRLPPVRQLAADLGLAVGTVGRAYRELEAAGKVSSRRGGGTRVTADAAPRPPAELARLAADYVAAARHLGITDRDLLAAVKRTLTGQQPH